MGWWSGGVQHWTVSEWVRHSHCAAQAAGLVSYLEAKPGVGPYNFLICAHGGRYEGRGWDRYSGANGSNATNRTMLAASYISGPGLPFTDEAKQAFYDLWVEAKVLGKVVPHRSITGSQCPGDAAIAWINAGMPVEGGSSVGVDKKLDHLMQESDNHNKLLWELAEESDNHNKLLMELAKESDNQNKLLWDIATWVNEQRESSD